MGNRRGGLIVFGLLLALCCGAARAETEGPWSLGFREGGKGFYMTSPDQLFQLNFLGYGQFVAGLFSEDYNGTPDRTDYMVGFQVRRARLALLATVYRNMEFLVEFGTPTLKTINGTAFPGATTPAAAAPVAPTTPSAPQRGTDFGLVEARATARIFDEAFQIRIGKFIGPFSGEQTRNPRNLDVIERSTIINSMNAIAALDTQIGVMFFGRILENVVEYYLAGFNGNADSFGTPIDDNNTKEIQLKLTFVPLEQHVHFGLGFVIGGFNPRVFSVLDHAFTPYISGIVNGRYYGGEVDLWLEWDWFSMNLETDFFSFPDSGAFANGLSSLYGAHLQLGWQMWGDKQYGFQFVSRGEWTRSNIDTSRDLFSAVAGFNIFINANLKNMVNYIAEIPSGTSPTAGAYASNRIHHILYNQLQFKF